jgi:hypothetical protein
VLKSNAVLFTTLAAAAKFLSNRVRTATNQWPLAELKPVIDALDAVTFPTGAAELDKYWKDLDKVLVDHANTQKKLPAGAPLPLSDLLSTEQVTVEQLEIKIERMNMLHRAVVVAVVLITAYTTLYWKDSDFGTLIDYLTVFLWALGLSATGANILTRAKSPSSRPT